VGRRRPGALFADEPEDATLPAPEGGAVEDESASSEPTTDEPAAAEAPKKRERTPEEIAARKAAREARRANGEEQTLRDIVRKEAGKTQLKRIKFYENIIAGVRIVNGKRRDHEYPLSIQMDAAKRLDEMAIDKTPTAQPVVTNRKRILTGFAGAIPGRYPGGSPVTKAPPAPPQQEAAANG
jgi:hypothetical protein